VQELWSHFRWSYIFPSLVFLGFGIQILGISLTDANLHPTIVPTPHVFKFVGYFGLGIAFVASFLSLAALMMRVRSDVKRASSAAERKFIWTVVVLAVPLSLPEWLWSCGGHPTWYMGFAG
jgi:hypothetical protein